MCKASEYSGGRGEYSSYEGRGEYSTSSSATPCECPEDKAKALAKSDTRQIEQKSPLMITNRTLSRPVHDF